MQRQNLSQQSLFSFYRHFFLSSLCLLKSEKERENRWVERSVQPVQTERKGRRRRRKGNREKEQMKDKRLQLDDKIILINEKIPHGWASDMQFVYSWVVWRLLRVQQQHMHSRTENSGEDRQTNIACFPCYSPLLPSLQHSMREGKRGFDESGHKSRASFPEKKWLWREPGIHTCTRTSLPKNWPLLRLQAESSLVQSISHPSSFHSSFLHANGERLEASLILVVAPSSSLFSSAHEQSIHTTLYPASHSRSRLLSSCLSFSWREEGGKERNTDTRDSPSSLAEPSSLFKFHSLKQKQRREGKGICRKEFLLILLTLFIHHPPTSSFSIVSQEVFRRRERAYTASHRVCVVFSHSKQQQRKRQSWVQWVQ